MPRPGPFDSASSSDYRAILKSWLGVADEVLRTVESTALQARGVAEQASAAFDQTRSSFRELQRKARKVARDIR